VTNASMDFLPGTCCSEPGGERLATLIVVVGVFLLVLAVTKWMKRRGLMNKVKSYAVVAILLIAVAAVVAMKIVKTQGRNAVAASSAVTNPVETQAAEQKAALPRLVDLGADKCIPCKMMAPILEALKKEYAGVIEVEFIDVWQNQDAGQEYGVRVIPTQIFFSSEGKELFRHEGFFSKEDILMKWKELGYGINVPTNGESNE